MHLSAEPIQPPSQRPRRAEWRVIVGADRGPGPVPASWYLAGLSLFALAGLLYLHSVKREDALLRTRSDIVAIKQGIAEKRSELARLQSPPRVEAAAVNSLGLKAPEEVVFMAPPPPVKVKAQDRIPLPAALPHEGF